MSKKTCDAFFCTNQTPKKYRYCYNCAKSKGLIGSGGGLFGWLILILIIMAFF